MGNPNLDIGKQLPCPGDSDEICSKSNYGLDEVDVLTKTQMARAL